MKLRLKTDAEKGVDYPCSSHGFNVHGIGEIIVGYGRDGEGGQDSDYIKNYDVWLEQKQEWKDLRQAFKDHDVITDNYNTRFFEPMNDEDRKRGYTL